MVDPPVIAFRGLTKHYGATVGIESLALTVDAGDVLGFLGPNGAGKTTTIRLMLGLIRPTHGEVRLFGVAPQRPEARRRVGYLPADLALDPRLTGRQTLAFLAALAGPHDEPARARHRAALCARLGLDAADLARPVRDYSSGMRQKLGLVAAFEGEPDLLVFDEPTTGLDPLVREAVFELIAEAGRDGRTVFHSSHVLSEVERVCTRVAILRAGRLVALERIDALRARMVRSMRVRFAAAVPDTEWQLPGVEIAGHLDDGVILRIAGPLDPLMARLARHPVRDIVFPEPTLEEAFVAHYRAGDPKDET